MCLSCGCTEPRRPQRGIEVADPTRLEPHEVVLRSAEDALARAESWIGWNGAAVMSLGNAWTPHKALRRITDHLIDHLCQIEARAGGEAPVPDPWRGRSVTLTSDWAPFTELEYEEAAARVRRLAQVLALRLQAMRPQWDADAGEEWTLRAIAQHLGDAAEAYASRPIPTATVAPPRA
jgi:hypothetical protein